MSKGKKAHPRRLKADQAYEPIGRDAGDEFFPNGLFEFNVTKMLRFLDANPEQFPVGEVVVASFEDFGGQHLNEKTIRKANISNPIVLVEISPGRFNVIDGNHRLARARRDGLKEIPVRRVPVEQHLPFLTSVKGYEKYIDYWNSKLEDLSE